VTELLARERAALDVVARPQLAELGEPAQPLEHGLEGGIVGSLVGGAAEVRHQARGLVGPVDQLRSERRIAERDEQRVAIGGCAPRVAEDAIGAAVPGQDVERAIGRVGRERQRVEDGLYRCRRRRGRRARRGRRRLVPGQHERVRALLGAEPERTRDRVERVGRRADVSTLLEPRVPGDAHAGELRDLLAAQARRAPPATAGRQPDLRRRQLAAPVAQELGERGPAARARSWDCRS